MIAYLQVFLAALLSALLVTPVVIRMALRLGIVDSPGLRKIHIACTPRLGGVALVLAAAIPCLMGTLIMHWPAPAMSGASKGVSVMVLGGVFLFLVGVVDDVRGLRARTKLMAQLFAAILFCGWAERLETIPLGFNITLHFGWWSWPLTIFWIVGVTNAINFSDGLDGLAAGISLIASAVFGGMALSNGQMALAMFLFAIVGALVGFLFFNFYPAKVFMGDGGSMFLGYILSASAILCTASSPTLGKITLPLLVLGVPIFDTLLSILRRFIERRSPFSPDRSHFHHRLLELGLKHRDAVIVIYAVTAMGTAMGLLMMTASDVGVICILAWALLSLLLVFRAAGSIRLIEAFTALRQRQVIARAKRSEQRAFENLQLLFRQAEDSSSLWRATCEAADQFNFAWLSLLEQGKNGSKQTSVWRNANYKPEPADKIVIVKIPVSATQSKSLEFEVAIARNGSLESAARRASLFGRLIDEKKRSAFYPRSTVTAEVSITDSGELKESPHGKAI